MPAYRIVTPRLVIRCWNPQDAPLLQSAIRESVEHLKPWMPWAHSDSQETIEDKIQRLRQFRARFDRDEDYVYAIFNREETRVLGGTGLHRRIGPNAFEIGYWLHKDFVNQGLITESTAALVKVGFEIEKVERIEIHCAPENVRSAAIPRKLGFTLEATLRKHIPFLDDWRDSMIWTLFRENYPNTPSASAKIEAYDAMGRVLS